MSAVFESVRVDEGRLSRVASNYAASMFVVYLTSPFKVSILLSSKA